MLHWLSLNFRQAPMRLLILLSACLFTTAQADTGFAKLQAGSNAVGFKVAQQYDYTRTWRGRVDVITGQPALGESARPIQALVWYPAQKGGTHLTYADYLRTQASDADFSVNFSSAEKFLSAQHKNNASRIGAAATDAAFSRGMWAVRDAAPLPEKYPVLIYAPGIGGVAHEVADIAELLTSHGYIVISSRSLGTHTSRMNADLEGVASQVNDIEFLLAYARTLPQADMTHVAAMGWSWGGMANVFAAERDHRIGVLVSLDGTREPEFTRKIAPERLTVPWLYVQRHPETVAQLSRAGIETSFSLLNEARYADVYQLVMYPMRHVDFSSAILRFQRPDWFNDYSRAEVEQAYAWTARYVLEFLNAYLKQDARARTFLAQTPAQNGVPPHMARLDHTPAKQGTLPTREGFAAALAQHGFIHAPELYKALHDSHPEFKLSEEEINQWGYQLLAADPDASKAIAIFRVGIATYPDSANLYDSLGEAYETAKNNASALASYRRSLDINPGNVHAAARVTALTTGH
jgi:dienelactone hydrolase